MTTLPKDEEEYMELDNRFFHEFSRRMPQGYGFVAIRVIRGCTAIVFLLLLLLFRVPEKGEGVVVYLLRDQLHGAEEARWGEGPF